MSEIADLLTAIERGEPQAAERLLPLVYDELRRLAAQHLAHERPGQTLDATALVHEAYLRLVGGETEQLWNSRGHFFAAAAESMRRILIDRARRKQAEKHGGGMRRIDFDRAETVACAPAEELLALNDALDALTSHDAALARLVQLRYFAGLSVEEAAEVLGLSRATAYRQWTFARAWLLSRLAGGAGAGSP